MNRVTTVHPIGSVNRGISRGRREVEAETPKVLGEDPNARGGTSWSAWRAGPPSEQLTVGIEDELMLLDPRDWSLAFRSDELIPDLPSDLCGRVILETYAAVMEIATGVHRRVAEATADSPTCAHDSRARWGRHGLRPAVAGTHPSAVWNDTAVSSHPRYRYVGDSTRVLARREPTLALHVHVGIARPQAAIRVMNRLRAQLPRLPRLGIGGRAVGPLGRGSRSHVPLVG